MFAHLLTIFADLLRFRQGPQALPSALVFTVLLALVNLLLGVVAHLSLGTDEGVSAGHAFGLMLFRLAVATTFVAVVLSLRGLSARANQTLSALFGTGIIFTLLVLPLLVLIGGGAQGPGLALVYFGLLTWSLAVDGHIFRHAVNGSMVLGALLAVTLFVLQLAASSWLTVDKV